MEEKSKVRGELLSEGRCCLKLLRSSSLSDSSTTTNWELCWRPDHAMECAVDTDDAASVLLRSACGCPTSGVIEREEDEWIRIFEVHEKSRGP